MGIFSPWHLWFIIAIILLIAEILTPGFLLASFGIGCLGSALAAGFGFGPKAQIAWFIAGTLVAFFGVRPFFAKYCYRASNDLKTNVEALIGKTGRVVEAITQEKGFGRVLVGGDDWKGVSMDGGTIEKGTVVEVVRVEGTKVYVKPI